MFVYRKWSSRPKALRKARPDQKHPRGTDARRFTAISARREYATRVHAYDRFSDLHVPERVEEILWIDASGQPPLAGRVFSAESTGTRLDALRLVSAYGRRAKGVTRIRRPPACERLVESESLLECGHRIRLERRDAQRRNRRLARNFHHVVLRFGGGRNAEPGIDRVQAAAEDRGRRGDIQPGRREVLGDDAGRQIRCQLDHCDPIQKILHHVERRAIEHEAVGVRQRVGPTAHVDSDGLPRTGIDPEDRLTERIRHDQPSTVLGRNNPVGVRETGKRR